NPLGTEDAARDLAVLEAGPGFVVLPKCGCGQDATELAARLSVAEAEAGLEEGTVRIMAIATETAASLFTLGTYEGATQRLAAMAWGMEDLSTALSATRTRDQSGTLTGPYALARTLCLASAHAAGVAPLDTVHTNIRDEGGLAQDCRDAVTDGFYGKMAIHPAQVAVINEAFTPDTEAVAHARQIVEAFDADPTAGVLSLDGKMIDRPHLENARNLLARAQGRDR
ncbi:MAG: CoA ester lyase, partial [Pseudomonadota bacterium]